jgi:hypothetical protein
MTTPAAPRPAGRGRGRAAAPAAPADTVQGRLTETTFANFLDGFTEVTPDDMLEARGGRVRYVIEELDPRGNVASRKFRLGGWLTKVDPALRYLRLMNPYARKAWSVQLRPGPRQRVRLYYMPPGTSDEVAALRNLLTQLENGEIRITRAP